MPKPGDFMRTAARLVENAVTGATPRRAMVAETAAAEGHSCSPGTVAVFTAPTALTFPPTSRQRRRSSSCPGRGSAADLDRQRLARPPGRAKSIAVVGADPHRSG